jgi:DNA-binding NarL/FixJ family response regulator
MGQTRHVSSGEREDISDFNFRNPGQDLLSQFEWQDVADVLSLSTRELHVAKLLLEGCTRDQIGSRLRKPSGECISPGTVRVYIDRLYRKARVDDRTALVLRVVRIFLGRDG